MIYRVSPLNFRVLPKTVENVCSNNINDQIIPKDLCVDLFFDIYFAGLPQSPVRPSIITVDVFSKIADSDMELSFEGATLAIMTLQKSLR